MSQYRRGDIIIYAEFDIGRWTFATGPAFPSTGLPLPHDGAVFFRTDLGSHYVWDEPTATWTIIGGGSGAPADAAYVTTAAHAGLSAEVLLGTVVMRGILAARPAAAIEGRLYYDTTNSILTRDNGVSWDNVGETAAAAPDQDARIFGLMAQMGF